MKLSKKLPIQSEEVAIETEEVDNEDPIDKDATNDEVKKEEKGSIVANQTVLSKQIRISNQPNSRQIQGLIADRALFSSPTYDTTFSNSTHLRTWI